MLLLVFVCLFESYSSSFVNVEHFQPKLPDLHWNSSNPIFQISNTDHIIDVNSEPGRYQQINIICPKYSAFSPLMSMEKHIIYNVDKEEYESCSISRRNPRIIAYCNEPTASRIFTISFRAFSPMPNSMEFHPGKSYYFISTATANSLYARKGGYCRERNMKIVFKVGSSQNDKPQARHLQHKNSLDRVFENSSIITINNPKTKDFLLDPVNSSATRKAVKLIFRVLCIILVLWK